MISKQKGFTLAEVLVTLAIIGVVAALTIPSLMNNIQEQQIKAKWKKTYSIISSVAMQITEEKGGSLLNVYTDADTYVNAQDFADDIAPYFNYAKKCTRANEQGCWAPSGVTYLNGAAGASGYAMPGFVLSDGTLLYVGVFYTACTNGGSDVFCTAIAADTNGLKGPNTVGKDIFYAFIKPNRVTPKKYDNTQPVCDVAIDSTGTSCSYYYLTH